MALALASVGSLRAPNLLPADLRLVPSMALALRTNSLCSFVQIGSPAVQADPGHQLGLRLSSIPILSVTSHLWFEPLKIIPRFSEALEFP